MKTTNFSLTLSLVITTLLTSLTTLVQSSPLTTATKITPQTIRDKVSLLADAYRQRSKMNMNTRAKRDRLEKMKRSSFDTLDWESILNDPMFLEEETDEADFNDNLHDLPFPPLEPEVDRMSNVIPGAHGPFDKPQPYHHHQEEPLPEYERDMQYVTNEMMEEFIEFLTLKEFGLLDKCLKK